MPHFERISSEMATLLAVGEEVAALRDASLVAVEGVESALFATGGLLPPQATTSVAMTAREAVEGNECIWGLTMATKSKRWTIMRDRRRPRWSLCGSWSSSETAFRLEDSGVSGGHSESKWRA